MHSGFSSYWPTATPVTTARHYNFSHRRACVVRTCLLLCMSVITRIRDRSEISLILVLSFHVKLFLNSWKGNCYWICTVCVTALSQAFKFLWLMFRITMDAVSSIYKCTKPVTVTGNTKTGMVRIKTIIRSYLCFRDFSRKTVFWNLANEADNFRPPLHTGEFRHSSTMLPYHSLP